ncbi:MAG: hypothetical protein IJF07_06475 [Lachnospiraceae bacterium]|nr:hypothetical protein [Lachnospiraceae bacterium]
MELLQRYLYKSVNIMGLDTHLIRTEAIDELLKDEELLQELGISTELIKLPLYGVKEIKKYKAYLAICYNSKVRRSFYFPTTCVEYKGNIYHVVYQSWWICRDCKTENGPFLRPLLEAESCLYAGLDYFKIPIPDIFTHKRCEKCGHLLQGHLMQL